jgi:hypothetical protein
MDLDPMFKDQQQLISNVPHEVRIDALQQMQTGMRIIESLILYLNSIGRKPWRPNQLQEETQRAYLSQINNHIRDLITYHNVRNKNTDLVDTKTVRLFTATYGTIEESIEFLNGVFKDTNPLEELTDELFYFMEQAIIAGYTPDQIKAQYDKKHEINLKRYVAGKANDFSWDDRDKKDEL